MTEIIFPNKTPLTYETWQGGGDKNWLHDQNWGWHDPYSWEMEARDPIGFSEKAGRQMFICPAEAILFIEQSSTANEYAKAFSEIFAVSETSQDNSWLAERSFDETVSIRSLPGKSSEKGISETLSVTDKTSFVVEISKRENLEISSAFGKAITFNRKIEEAITIEDLYGKTFALDFAETFTTYDSLLQSARGVISDILFEDGSWTMETVQDYMLKGRHVGYEAFKPFIAGDYTYKNALFRVSMDASGADRGLLEQFQIVVDVPDVNDRGSAEVTDANFDLTVKFNKTFHIAPEVVCTMRTGSSDVCVTPIIVEITETQFKVYLTDALTGKRTTGRFIWNAIGY